MLKDLQKILLDDLYNELLEDLHQGFLDISIRSLEQTPGTFPDILLQANTVRNPGEITKSIIERIQQNLLEECKIEVSEETPARIPRRASTGMQEENPGEIFARVLIGFLVKMPSRTPR